MNLIINNHHAKFETSLSIGGKAKNLALLNNYPVPNWFVLSTGAFDLFLRENNKFSEFNELLCNLDNENHLAIVSEKIFQLIDLCHFPASLKEQITSRVNDNHYYAVRSSAVDEDGTSHSFAGIMESYLYQQGMEQIEKSIKACYQSCFSKRALKYRLDKQIDLTQLKMAVIIQEMVPAEKSGVLFTANPTNGNRHEFVVSANYGLGEGVVNGECETDEYIVDINQQKIESHIREKDFYYIKLENTPGVDKQELPTKLQLGSTLSDQEVLKLIDIGRKIARDQRYPQDIEWAIHQDQVYILQTRDITSLLPPLQSTHAKIVFDNSNIQESYCGITTPLTFSYANEAYFRVYHQMLSIMGLKESVIKKHEKRHWNMISLIKGRVYYNINSWYEGLLLFPSFKNNKDSMEKMMGLQDPVDFIKDKNFTFKQKLELLPTLFRCYWNLILYFIRIDKLVEDFTTHFETEYKKFDKDNFCFLDLSQLFHLTDNIIDNITSNWHAPIINDFYVMTFHGKALRLLQDYQVKNPEITLSNLLSGEEGIQSTEPTKQLLRITDQIQTFPELKDKFKQLSPELIHVEIQSKYPAIKELCENYIELFGDRVVGELKLESISLREDPSFIYACLKTYLQNDMSLSDYLSNEKELRIKTEKVVFSDIKKRLGSKKLKKFKKLLNNTRKGVKYRENMRLMRTRVFGLSREIYLEMGRQFQTYGVLDHHRDIFYLTLDELERYRMGRSVQTNLNSLVNARKAEYQSYDKNDEPAYHFHTSGPVYLGNKFQYPYQKESSSELKGLGCYPGVVEEEVATIFSPDAIDDINGKIVCTLRTDPGWAPIFPMIKGLIVERGSMLSHSAVIARELGIPTIVGVPDITKKLATGDLIRMDGELGTIEIIKSSQTL